MLPTWLIVRAYLARSLRLWLGLRLLLAAVGALAASYPFRLSAGTIVPIVVLTVLVAFVDTRRRREQVLLGNLGVSATMLAALFAVPPLIAEIAIHVLASR
jgi:hypothetical protein